MVPRTRAALALVALMVGYAALAPAHEEPKTKGEQEILYRHSVYQVMKWNFARMGAAVQGKIPYDRAAFAKQAQRLAQMTPMLDEAYPPDSYVAGKTAARPEIWRHFDDFQERLKKLASSSAAFAEVARTGDFEQIKQQFPELAQNCKSCHDKYREEEH